MKNFFRNIKYGIENLISWFPIIWKDRNWDCNYFFKILEKKLELYEKVHTNGIYKGWEPVAKKIKIAKILCKRLAEEEVYYNNNKIYYNQNLKNTETHINSDLKLLCDIIYKESRKWWD